MRRGLCRGSGKQGYYNVAYQDPMIHGLSAKGISTRRKPQPVGTNLTRLKWNDKVGLIDKATNLYQLSQQPYCEFHNTWDYKFFYERNIHPNRLNKMTKDELINLIRDYEVAKLSIKNNHKNLYSNPVGLSGNDLLNERGNPSHSNVDHSWFPEIPMKQYEITLESNNPKDLTEYGFGDNPPIVIMAHSQQEALSKLKLPKNVKVKKIEHFHKLNAMHLLSAKDYNPNISDELAHNLNPIKLRGVDKTYPLNPNN